MIEYGHFIGGKHVAGTSGRKQDVMQPMDGTVRGTVALASPAELRAAVENAKEAQPKWAATNPQRRVRVLMKFLELVARDYDELADILAREHGKTIADAKGDIQRGLEVVEVCIGTPGSRSEGFRMNALPQAIAGAIFHSGIIAGKLNGVMPATTPSGWRIEYTSMPGPAPSVNSPFIMCGAPMQTSTTSRPRWMSPLASAMVLPCSRARMSASSS